MNKLEDKILNALNIIGYNGPLRQRQNFDKAIEIGPRNQDYTQLVHFLTNEIRMLLSIDEEVNPISAPEDAVAFVMEISSFLKELNCPYKFLTDGHVSERLEKVSDRLVLLDYLATELMGARILQEKKPDKKIELKLQESSQAADLRSILMTLQFSKPPPNISLATLFGKLGPTINLVLDKTGVDLVGKAIFNGVLSDKQWDTLNNVQSDLSNEYKIRREMLLTRLDVTIQSFQWSDKTKGKEQMIEKIYSAKRKLLKAEPDVHLADLLAARADLAIIEKTSNSSVRRNTKTSIQKVIIGQVPDRGGRTSEQAPPPPEMPSWQQRSAGPPGGGRGGGRGGRGDFNRGSNNNYNRGGSSNFNRGGGTSNYNRGGNSQGNYNSSNFGGGSSYSSYDSAGSYNVSSGGGQSSSNYDNSNSRDYNNSGTRNYSSYDSAGSYSNRGGNDYRRDSFGEQQSKRVKTFDSFQANKTTYADQYVQESQHNQQYHSRGDNRNSNTRGGGRGRSNYNRGGGNSYR